MRAEYDRLESEVRHYKQELRQLIDLPAITLDGTAIALYANVSKFADTEAALLYNADGIGLYRTEFGFSVRPSFPSEDEQYEFLKRAAERLHPRRVVFRLLDLGGDKELPVFPPAPLAQPLAGRPGHPPAAQAPGDPAQPAAGVPAGERRTPGLGAAAGGGRRRRRAPGAGAASAELQRELHRRGQGPSTPPSRWAP